MGSSLNLTPLREEAGLLKSDRETPLKLKHKESGKKRQQDVQEMWDVIKRCQKHNWDLIRRGESKG